MKVKTITLELTVEQLANLKRTLSSSRKQLIEDGQEGTRTYIAMDEIQNLVFKALLEGAQS